MIILLAFTLRMARLTCQIISRQICPMAYTTDILRLEFDEKVPFEEGGPPRTDADMDSLLDLSQSIDPSQPKADGGFAPLPPLVSPRP